MDNAQIAQRLAIDAKAGGFGTDFGDLFCGVEHGHLSEAKWNEVCDLAQKLLPDVVVPRETAAAWAQANREFRSEQRAERVAFRVE